MDNDISGVYGRFVRPSRVARVIRTVDEYVADVEARVGALFEVVPEVSEDVSLSTWAMTECLNTFLNLHERFAERNLRQAVDASSLASRDDEDEVFDRAHVKLRDIFERVHGRLQDWRQEATRREEQALSEEFHG